jgi:hypothetical protein
MSDLYVIYRFQRSVQSILSARSMLNLRREASLLRENRFAMLSAALSEERRFYRQGVQRPTFVPGGMVDDNSSWFGGEISEWQCATSLVSDICEPH